jgi:hypothetical protein
MENNADKLQAKGQHDEKIFRDGAAIFSENDLRETINYIYSEYQYKGAQLDKLVAFINYLSSEINKYSDPELADQCKRLSAWLDNFLEFLQHNFHQQGQTEDGDRLYILTVRETGFETEAFLIEFQMISLDIEKAYRGYQAAIINKLKNSD